MPGFFANIGNLFSSGPGVSAANRAARAQSQAYQEASEAGTDLQRDYTNRAITSAQQGLPNWQTLFGEGTARSPVYMGGLGIGTPEQISGAQQAFMGSIPGQEFQNLLPDIYETSLRRGGLTGQTGQVPLDLTNRAMQALNQFYPAWQQALDPYKYQLAGATGEQGVYNTVGERQANLGTALSNLRTQSIMGQGNTEAQRIQNVFGANTAAGRNSLDALFAAASLAAAPFTGGASLGGLGGLFSGGGGSGGYLGSPQSYQAAWGEPGVGGITSNLGYF